MAGGTFLSESSTIRANIHSLGKGRYSLGSCIQKRQDTKKSRRQQATQKCKIQVLANPRYL
eukprot:1472498-Amphidinium_carterae.1